MSTVHLFGAYLLALLTVPMSTAAVLYLLDYGRPADDARELPPVLPAHTVETLEPWPADIWPADANRVGGAR